MYELKEDKQILLSAKGLSWQIKQVDERKIIHIIQKYYLPELVARILASRIEDIDTIPSFLGPTLRDYLPNPLHFLDMKIAAERLLLAIEKQEKTVIFGDYDVDGATSSALLKRFFHDVGLEVGVYIPDRILEGYGPSKTAIHKLKEQGAQVIITVDCGTMAFEPLAEAKKLGIDVIVIDHHISDVKLPEALAVVNPNRVDEKSPHGYLAAVGMAFMLAVAINMLLKEQGRPICKDLFNYLDLVALGTICDVVPLEGVNRALVVQGLKVSNFNKNIGLNALKEVAGINSPLNVYHMGFVIGPRINAGGRVGQCHLGTTLLSSNDIFQARDISKQLDNYNSERKTIELEVFAQALSQATLYENEPLLVLSGENWHPGVIGIVAGRLKELYNKPVAIISIKDGIGKASCRSIKNIDFGSHIVSAKMLGIVKEGGGHAMAAGFTIMAEKITELRTFLSESFSKIIQNINIHERFYEGCLSVNAINLDLARMIETLGPFGAGNHEPRFFIKNVFVISATQFGDSHLNVILGSSGTAKQGNIVKAKAFRALDNSLGNAILSRKNMDVIGTVKINRWNNNESLEFIIDDVICS